MRSSALVCPLIFITLTACSNPAEGLKAKENPKPSNGYIITLDASAAPGEISQTSASASFETIWSGTPCMPEPPGWAEWRMPWQYIDVPLKKVGANLYEGVFYTDGLLDETYFKKNTFCAWRMNTVSAGFVGQGGLGFGVGISYSELKDGAQNTMYYPLEDFTDTKEGRMFPHAYSVPTDDFKDLKNSYVNDKSKYFPVYLRARVLPGGPGLAAMEEFNQRVRQENPTGQHAESK